DHSGIPDRFHPAAGQRNLVDGERGQVQRIWQGGSKEHDAGNPQPNGGGEQVSKSRKKMDLWNWVSVLLLLLFLIFFIYPCVRLMWEAFYTEEAGFTLDAFVKFFSKSYYFSTILNSFKVSIAVMAL